VKIYVGNLSYDTNESSLRNTFSTFGQVSSVSIVMDHYTGKCKGFAFIDMASKDEAEAAIAGLNGKVLNSRNIKVDKATPRNDNRSGAQNSRNNRGGFGGGRRY